MSETCLSVGTVFATKKSWAAFSKSIATAKVRSPEVSTGALPLVGSTVARVDMGVFNEVYVQLLSSDESDESTKDEEVLIGSGGDWEQLGMDG
jgi:hypothetical protein